MAKSSPGSSSGAPSRHCGKSPFSVAARAGVPNRVMPLSPSKWLKPRTLKWAGMGRSAMIRSSRCTARSASRLASRPSRQMMRSGSARPSAGSTRRQAISFDTESAQPTRKVVVVVRDWSRTISSNSSPVLKMLSAWLRMRRPVSVNSSWRPLRRNSSTPRVSANSLSWPEIDCGVRCSCSAARAMLPVLATIQK
ncbi:hypothetical protein D3C87_1204180 [compost metagenome]